MQEQPPCLFPLWGFLSDITSSLNYIWCRHLWGVASIVVHFLYCSNSNIVFDYVFLKWIRLKFQIFITHSTNTYWRVMYCTTSLLRVGNTNSIDSLVTKHRVSTTVISVYFPESKDLYSTILWPVNLPCSLLNAVLEIGAMKWLFSCMTYPQGFLDIWVKIMLLSSVDFGSEWGLHLKWRCF